MPNFFRKLNLKAPLIKMIKWSPYFSLELNLKTHASNSERVTLSRCNIKASQLFTLDFLHQQTCFIHCSISQPDKLEKVQRTTLILGNKHSNKKNIVYIITYNMYSTKYIDSVRIYFSENFPANMYSCIDFVFHGGSVFLKKVIRDIQNMALPLPNMKIPDHFLKHDTSL